MRQAVTERERLRRKHAQYKAKCAEVARLRIELARMTADRDRWRALVGWQAEIVDIAERVAFRETAAKDPA